jgi:hypothetical protein
MTDIVPSSSVLWDYKVHSIELNGVPPPNSKNRSAAYVIAEGDGGIFTINEK